MSDYFWIIAGIIFFIIYFGYGPYERHRRRLKESKPPDDLLQILNGLPSEWRLISYHWLGDNWTAELANGDRHFGLATDYGYPGPISIDEIGAPAGSLLASPLDPIWMPGGPDIIRQQLIHGPMKRKDLRTGGLDFLRGQ